MKPLLLTISIIFFFSCRRGTEKTYPQYKSLYAAIYASATIQPDSLYEVFSKVSGILEKNLVTEGDIVRPGTPIAQLINTKSQLDAENARLLYAFSQKQYAGNATLLKAIEQEIHAAQLKLQDDSINYARQERLWSQNIGSKAQYESRRLAYQTSQTTLTNLKNRLNRTKDELQNQFSTAQNRYKTALTTTEDFTIRSTIHGKVYALYKNSGENISPQIPIALIGSIEKFIIEMLVDEVDIIRVKKDKEIVLTMDAYPDTLFQAIVHRIYPAKNIRNQTFLVEGQFIKQPPTLFPGLSGEANIIVQQKDSALVIPKSYLINTNQVRTKEGLINIVKGQENMEYVEIISGIDTKTEIIQPEQ